MLERAPPWTIPGEKDFPPPKKKKKLVMTKYKEETWAFSWCLSTDQN